MAITAGYCTLAEIREHIGDPDGSNDLKLENVVTSVSRWIDTHCERHFWQTSAGTVRVFDTCDDRLLRLGPYNDIVTLTALKTDDDKDGVFETTWAAGDYQLLPLNPAAAPETWPYRRVRAVASRVFPWVTGTGREGLIQITGTWGWPAIPATVKEACLIQAAQIFRRKDAPQGVLGFNDFITVRVDGRLDPHVAQNLHSYRHGAAVGAVA